MNTTPATPPHDDGLEWLRSVRRKLMAEAGGDLQQLGNKYRQTEARHPEKVIEPREFLTNALRQSKQQ